MRSTSLFHHRLERPAKMHSVHNWAATMQASVIQPPHVPCVPPFFFLDCSLPRLQPLMSSFFLLLSSSSSYIINHHQRDLSGGPERFRRGRHSRRLTSSGSNRVELVAVFSRDILLSLSVSLSVSPAFPLVHSTKFDISEHYDGGGSRVPGGQQAILAAESR